MASTTVLGTIEKVIDGEDRHGYIRVAGRQRDFRFKVSQVAQSGGLQLGRGDVVKCGVRQGRSGEYLHHIELLTVAPKTSRQLEALKQMSSWQQLKNQAVLMEAQSLPVWKAVLELVGKSQDPQWDSLHSQCDAGAGDAADAVGVKRLPRRDFVYGQLADEILRENAHLREHLQGKVRTMRVQQVFFTHGDVSPHFRNGSTLTQLVSDLRRGNVLPVKDDRMFLEVFQLKGRIRSVNNRRLWVLKQFQHEQAAISPHLQCGVKVHRLCRGTARFLADLGQAAASRVTAEVASHPEMLAARRTLQEVMEEDSSRPWIFEDRAELRSRVALDDLRYAGQSVFPRKRRRSAADDDFVDAECQPSSLSAADRKMAERICGGISQGKQVLDVVEFRGEMYIADKKMAEKLHALQQDRAGTERFCVNVRVIPLCPMTAKVVLANSTRNNGESVHIRGSLRDSDGWPLDRIVSLLLDLAESISQTPRARQIYEVLASSRLLGERSAVIRVIRSKQRWSAEVLRSSWSFLQQLMKLAPSKFQSALPICNYLCHAERNSAEDAASQLLSLVSSASQQLSGGSGGGGTAEVPWNCMAMVPSEVELKSLEIMPNTRKRSALQRLPVVRQCGSYRSAGEYFDTYFRLLREDCLSAICHSFTYVRKHRGGAVGSGAKDEAAESEGNVFRGKLKGFTVGRGDCDSRIKVVLQVEPMFSGNRWKFRATRFFMNGNLLACVCDNDFSNPMWLLAARRDLHQREAEVALEFYLSDGSDEASLVARLCTARRTTLIASPTYFRSFEPVLQSLKTWEAAGLPFHQELVDCEPMGLTGMQADRRVQRSLIFQGATAQDPEDPAPEVKTAKDDDHIMLSDLPHHVASSSGAQYQVLGVSADVMGLSWTLPTKGKTEVMVKDEVLFELSRPSAASFSCLNRCPHQIQLQLPGTSQPCLRFLEPGASADVQVMEEIVTSTGAREYRFRLSPVAGTVKQLQLEIGEALRQPTGPLARATTWDDSQLRAAEHALQCRVALIQGPPGTGKTFIGCKLLQMFLPQSRVLVLTYKNHALDDFLEHCIDAGHAEQVARIGGRSTTERQELQNCHLRSLRKKVEAPAATRKKGRRSGDGDTGATPALQQLLTQASHSKLSVAEEQHHFLQALEIFRDRGVHRLESFLLGISGLQLMLFLERWLESWWPKNAWQVSQLPHQYQLHGRRLQDCLKRVREKFQEIWEQLPARLHAIDNQDPDAQTLEDLKYYLDWALLDWYPPKELLDGAANEYFAEIAEQEVEEKVERVVPSDEVKVQVHDIAELRKVQRNLGANQQVFRSFQLADGQVIHQGWRLCSVDPSHVDVAAVALAAAELPLTLGFEADDEAERELQAEIEAERMQGAGLDTRESLSEAERKAMIPVLPDAGKRPQVERLPYNLSGDHSINVPSRDWFRLDPQDRARVVVRQLAQQGQQCFQRLQEAVQSLGTACEEEKANEVNFNAHVLENKKIIGMTITGASIHLGLLKQMKPDVVIVEEAAEVLEPQILAVLGPWVKHLILIGDQHQLRPPVETYTLKLNHLFDTSMLERLIHNRLPNVQLCRQGRMLPSLSKLLLPIYKFLRDNEKVVQKLRPPDCVKSEVFFWNCPHEEEKTERSHINKSECERALQLCFYFISQGIRASSITLLAAYQAQISQISRQIKDRLPEFLKQTGFKRDVLPCKVEIDPNLIRRNSEVEITETVLQQGRVVGEEVKVGRYWAKVDAEAARRAQLQGSKVQALLEPSTLQQEEMPEMSTIDRYQGAENEIVIVSLVRSNQQKKIGFLGTEDGKNRMCVAQSRAKRGLYFVGNVECMRSAIHWKLLLDQLDERGCVGDLFPQICPRHPEIRNFAKEAENVGIVCRHRCGKAYGCGIAGHLCTRQCHADDGGESHQDLRCPYLVEKTYNCQESPAHVFPNIACGRRTENLPCPFFEDLRCRRDLHDLRRTCGETVEHATFVCPNPCTTRLACGHLCPKKCSERCIADAECPELVDFDCPNFSKHSKIRSACNSTPKQIAAKCTSKCSRLLACGHHCDERCCDPCTTQCKKPCKKTLPCGHTCPKKCSEECAEVSECQGPKLFDCPRSKEHQQIMSRCNANIEDLKALCQSPCGRALPCGHDCQEKCCEPCTTQCKKPCTKRLECGHICPLECWQTCIETSACQSECGRKMPCGHECRERCCDRCVCNELCHKRLDCGHLCLMKCQEACKCMMPKAVPCKKTAGRENPHEVRGMCCENEEDIALKCREPCREELPCGHLCTKLCGECTPHEAGECQESCGRELTCGHLCPRPCGACGAACAAPCEQCLRPPAAKAMPRPVATKAMPRPPEVPPLIRQVVMERGGRRSRDRRSRHRAPSRPRGRRDRRSRSRRRFR